MKEAKQMIIQHQHLKDFLSIGSEKKIIGYDEGKNKMYAEFPIMAKTDEDFLKILKRESKLRKIDEQLCKAALKEDLQQAFSEIKKYFKFGNFRTPSEITELEALLNRFITFLDKKPAASNPKPTPKFSDYLPGKFINKDGTITVTGRELFHRLDKLKGKPKKRLEIAQEIKKAINEEKLLENEGRLEDFSGFIKSFWPDASKNDIDTIRKKYNDLDLY